MYVFFMSSMAYLFIFLIVSFDKHKFYNFKEVLFKKQETWGFPGGSDGKASACNAGDPGLIPGSGRSPGEGNGNPFLYSCLENSMDGGA